MWCIQYPIAGVQTEKNEHQEGKLVKIVPQNVTVYTVQNQAIMYPYGLYKTKHPQNLLVYPIKNQLGTVCPGIAW